MGKVGRHFATTFTKGSISSTLTLEGERADELPDLLDRIQAVISGQTHTELIPQLEQFAGKIGDENEPLAQPFQVEETVVLDLLGHVFTIDILLELDRKPESPYNEMLGFLVVHAISAAVISDAAGRFSKRLYHETQWDYYKEHPEDAPDSPCDGINFLDMLRGTSVGIVGLN